MSWLAELMGRVIWDATDGGVRFVAAMGVMTLQVLVIVRWMRRRVRGTQR